MKDSYQFSVVSYQLLVVSWKCLGKRGSVNLLGNVGNVGICRLTRCIFVGRHL